MTRTTVTITTSSRSLSHTTTPTNTSNRSLLLLRPPSTRHTSPTSKSTTSTSDTRNRHLRRPSKSRSPRCLRYPVCFTLQTATRRLPRQVTTTRTLLPELG